MRLLFCSTCKSVEEVPDPPAPLVENEYDPLIGELVERHTVKDPMGHGGVQLKNSPFRIGAVDNEAWERDREGVLKAAQDANKKVGFDVWAYEAMNTYVEDALLCYQRHKAQGDMTLGCIDWRDDSKRLGRPTLEGRKQLKDQYKLAKRDPFLCDFCPVRSVIQTEINWRKGLYN